MISPFNVYGYDNRVYFVSIPTQRNAGYSKPAETKEVMNMFCSFFGQNYGASPNIAHIVSIEAPETDDGDSCESD